MNKVVVNARTGLSSVVEVTGLDLAARKAEEATYKAQEVLGNTPSQIAILKSEAMNAILDELDKPGGHPSIRAWGAKRRELGI